MKNIPSLDYSRLKLSQEKPVGKYGNLTNYIKSRDGVDVDDATLDKKLRTFFEDLITEILKNPESFDKTRNINFTELFNYLGQPLYQEKERVKVVPFSNWEEEFKKMTAPDEVIRPEMKKITPESQAGRISFLKQINRK